MNNRILPVFQSIADSKSQFEVDRMLMDLSQTSCNDPKWVDLFVETFIKPSPQSKTNAEQEQEKQQNSGVHHEDMDDLLFFVRQVHLNSPTDQSRVFVKRKTGNQVPELDDLISWKETFFLNCIIHMDFEMTVALCERRNVPMDYQDFPLKSAGNVRGLASPDGINVPKPAPMKKAMVPVKAISKRVYSSPHKSRMDKKTSDNELAYPIVYFCVNDFEDAFEETVIQTSQYLCVELACDMRRSLPDGSNDIVHTTLFQGAVPFQALHDTYVAKQSSSASGNPFKALQRISRNITSTLSSGFNTNSGVDASSSANRKRFGLEDDDRQYVMMRGPNGKGHAQVAIKPATLRIKSNQNSNATNAVNSSTKSLASITSSTYSLADTSVSSLNSQSNLPPSASASSGLNDSSEPSIQQQQSSVSRKNSISRTPSTGNDMPPLVQSFRRLSTQVIASFKQPEVQELPIDLGLACFLTYIHLTWQSIVSDIIGKLRLESSSPSTILNPPPDHNK